MFKKNKLIVATFVLIVLGVAIRGVLIWHATPRPNNLLTIARSIDVEQETIGVEQENTAGQPRMALAFVSIRPIPRSLITTLRRGIEKGMQSDPYFHQKRLFDWQSLKDNFFPTSLDDSKG